MAADILVHMLNKNILPIYDNGMPICSREQCSLYVNISLSPTILKFFNLEGKTNLSEVNICLAHNPLDSAGLEFMKKLQEKVCFCYPVVNYVVKNNLN